MKNYAGKLVLYLCICFSFGQIHELAIKKRHASRNVTLGTRNKFIRTPPLDNQIDNFQLYTGEVSNITEQELKGGTTSIYFYYATMLFGGQEMNLDIDTGSALTAIALSDCRNCYGNTYDPMHSQGFVEILGCNSPQCKKGSCDSRSCLKSYSEQNVCDAHSNACCSFLDDEKCAFNEGYGDGSQIYGVLVEAETKIGNITTRTTFGGILDHYYFLRNYRDGILGLAYKSLACNPTCTEPIFDTLVRKKLVKEDIFSLCIDKNGGALVLGGVNQKYYAGDIDYVPMTGSKDFYKVNISSTVVASANRTLSISNITTGVFDSGTTLLGLSETIFNTLQEHMTTDYCHIPGLCGELSWFSHNRLVVLSSADLKELPDMKFLLSDTVEIVLTPEDYMLEWKSNSVLTLPNDVTIRRLGIFHFDPKEFGVGAILGDVVHQKYYTVYDRKNYRMGIALRTNCSSETSNSSNNVYESIMKIPFLRKSHDTISQNSSVGSLSIILAFIGLVLLVVAILHRVRSRGEYATIN